MTVRQSERGERWRRAAYDNTGPGDGVIRMDKAYSRCDVCSQRRQPAAAFAGKELPMLLLLLLLLPPMLFSAAAAAAVNTAATAAAAVSATATAAASVDASAPTHNGSLTEFHLVHISGTDTRPKPNHCQLFFLF